MAKAFSLASWNVEHFRGNPARVERVVNFLKNPAGGNSPDIFALYEVVGSQVYGQLMTQLPRYNFHITEGPQVQEILVGVKSNFTSFFTQKVEFKAGNRYLRPGAVLTVRVGNEDYTILFLHTKSSTDPIGLGLRDEMFRRACRFRRVLNKGVQNGRANFIFLGDLNTMGMKYPYDYDIEAGTELRRLQGRARRSRMNLLAKDEPHTWWDGGTRYPLSDLDQVVAAEHLQFTQFNGRSVTVRGWPKLPAGQQRRRWIDSYSDHGLLYLEVQK